MCLMDRLHWKTGEPNRFPLMGLTLHSYHRFSPGCGIANTDPCAFAELLCPELTARTAEELSGSQYAPADRRCGAIIV